MRTIKYIAVHCTASSQNTTIAQLMSGFRLRGWKYPGYHYVVQSSGKVVQLLDVDKVSNGVRGYNSECINIAYIGGIDAKGKAIDNRTPEQKAALRELLMSLRGEYPTAIIQGHRDFSPDLNKNGKIESNEWIKMCPSFDAKAEYRDI